MAYQWRIYRGGPIDLDPHILIYEYKFIIHNKLINNIHNHTMYLYIFKYTKMSEMIFF